MKKLFLLSTIIFALLFFVVPAGAQEEVIAPGGGDPFPEELSEEELFGSNELGVSTALEKPIFFKGRILDVVEEGETEFGSKYQILDVRIESGSEKDNVVTINHGTDYPLEEERLVASGDKVVINKVQTPDGDQYFVADAYRLSAVYWIFAIFVVLIVLFAGRKGVGSLAGLAVSIGIIIWYIIPQIIEGGNPLWVSLSGALLIMIVTIYLAHGISKKTSVAVISTFVTLLITVLAANYFVEAANLFGLGSEEAFLLQYDLKTLNLRGLLLGGIIIGVLGVLDDITTAQSAAIYELKRANSKFKFKDLYDRGLNIGREHIAALVNTLALAYVGTSLPLLLLLTLESQVSLWVMANSELIVEEIIRTLVGSTSLVMAVPITTFAAAWYFGKEEELPDIGGPHGHTH